MSLKVDKDSFKKYASFTILCKKILENPSDLKLLEELKKNIQDSPKSLVKGAQKPLITSFFPYMQNATGNRISLNDQGKQLVVEALNELLNKLNIENTIQFFNFYTFLLLELYDYANHSVLPVSEEYKDAVLKCMISLINSVSMDILENLYVKENVPKFSQIIYVCSQIAKQETARNIRITAITCIMAMAQVLKPDNFNDIVLRSKCADVFMFFVPGLSNTLPEIALEDLKVGHAVPMMSIRAYGRIVSMVMQDYDQNDEKTDLFEILAKVSKNYTLKGKLKSKQEVDQYLDNTSRNTQWYKTTDEKLNLSLKKMGSLTYHSHENVKLEMVHMAASIVMNCTRTMPQSICTVIEHLIIFSQDSSPEISKNSSQVIDDLSKKLSSEEFSSVFESLKEGFYNAINSLPRKFNSVDDAEKVATLNLLLGYIKLFGEHKLTNVLLSPTMLNNLLQGMLHIAELEKSNISLLEEYILRDFTEDATSKPSWINFCHFKDDFVKVKLDLLCKELAKNSFEVIYDSLLDTFLYDTDKKKESIYLLNAHLLGLEESDCDRHLAIIKNILNTYAAEPLNDLTSALDTEEHSLEEIQNNVVMICLLTEGIGNISLILKEKFQMFLLKVLYLVLEKAGSGHPLIRTSGLMTLQNIKTSCGYKDLTQMMNSNFDFFSYHVQRRLVKLDDKEGVLNVLSVVLQYSDVDVLLPMKNIVEDVLVISCDRFKEKYATSYLKVFKMFILSLRRWFKIEFEKQTFKSKKEKEMELENFKVTGIDYSNSLSDDHMQGKTAEEMYKEDMERKAKENNEECDTEETDYKKPTPPTHVELTSMILKRSLHFLPSKNQNRRLLVLEILENGIEILRDWEDELLPVVHQIWSPLVQRFKEDNEPLIMRLSIRLVAALARLSKDFIRMRVVKELLPRIKEILEKSAASSYLKDKGSAYRYSQSYKLQRELISTIGPILYNLDVEGNIINDVIESIHFYLSDKQPQELQMGVINFFKIMCTYDCETIKEKLASFENRNQEYNKNLERIKTFIEC